MDMKNMQIAVNRHNKHNQFSQHSARLGLKLLNSRLDKQGLKNECHITFKQIALKWFKQLDQRQYC